MEDTVGRGMGSATESERGRLSRTVLNFSKSQPFAHTHFVNSNLSSPIAASSPLPYIVSRCPSHETLSKPSAMSSAAPLKVSPAFFPQLPTRRHRLAGMWLALPRGMALQAS